MKIALGTLVICLLALFAFAQTHTSQPLNANTGLWQISETVTWTGLPPQYAAMMKNGATRKYNKCVKPKDLTSNPWAEPGRKCSWTILNSDATNLEIRSTSCALGNGMTADAHGTIHLSDSRNGTGSFDLTMNGTDQNMKAHATYVGSWIGACPGNSD
jgi:hypothetical protein